MKRGALAELQLRDTAGELTASTFYHGRFVVEDSYNDASFPLHMHVHGSYKGRNSTTKLNEFQITDQYYFSSSAITVKVHSMAIT